MQLGETLVESIFFEALEQPSPAERAAFLDRACGTDASLRTRVEQLLGAEPRLGDFLNAAPPVDVPAPTLEATGTTIGPYHLRELLGEGGMGTVYVVEQTHPVRRTMALKLIKPGMDSREVIARFEAERQALALMDHPYIAKVLDVGTTEAGRPYFVMELIRGWPITEDCDRRQSRTRERLQLFIKVCQGMQHAHGKGIIHRDLKPSNVLVTHYDDQPMPKIIDFGVAKAMDQRLTEHTIYTRFAQVIGSPLYMSPEQAELNASEVDIRSDVYSLGVLLYELLTGTTPFDSETLKQAGLDGLRKKICEEEPPKPSTRVSTLDEAKRSTVCDRRGTDSRRLKLQLRGDLDWIVMKALEKDRARRYESAGALADDLQRFLAEKPVVARPPTALYRARKFVRRVGRRINIPSALLVTISLVLVGLLAAFEMSRLFGARSVRDGNSLASAPDVKIPAVPPAQAPQAIKSKPSAPVAGRDFPGLLPEPDWRPEIGRWQLITKRPRGVLRSAVWSPNEDRFALCESNHVRIYDAENLRLKHVLVGHTQPVRSVAWHADGKRLASSSEDGTVRLWTEDGAPTHQLVGHDGVVYQVAWRPNSEQLASASADGTVRIWNADGTIERVIEEGKRHIFCLDWRDDGALLATGGGDITPLSPHGAGETLIRFWNPETGALVSHIGGTARRTALSIDWHPGGQQLAVGYGDFYRCTQEAFVPVDDAGVVIWRADGSVVARIENQIGTVNAVAWDALGQRLAFGGRHGTLRLFNLETHDTVEINVGHKIDLYSLSWRKSGESLLSTSRESVREWHGDDSVTPIVLGLSEQGLKYVKWHPEGTRLAAEISGKILFWDADGAELPDERAAAGQQAPWWRHLYGPYRSDGKPQPALEGGHPARMREWEWSSQGWLAGVSWADASVRIWNDRGQLIAKLSRHRGGVESVSWNPAGNWLASGGGDSVRLWKSDGTPGPVMRGHADEVYPVAWSPDGQWIASGGSDSVVRLWKPDGTAGPIFRGHTGGIHDLAWSPDSTRLASASWLDSTLRVWDISTGRTLWQALLIEPDRTMTLLPDGQPLRADEELMDTELACVVERLDGATDLLSHKELYQRFAKLAVDQTVEAMNRAVQTGEWDALETKYRAAVAVRAHANSSQQDKLAEAGLALGNGLFAKQEFDRAGTVLQATLPILRDTPAGHILLARIYQRQGDEESAKSSLQAAIGVHEKVNETVNKNWRAHFQHDLALLRLMVGDVAGYRRVCRGMLEEFRDTPNLPDARYAAWVAALHPDALEDLEPAVQLAARAAEAQPGVPAFQDCHGAILCRAGRYPAAIQRLMDADQQWEQSTTGSQSQSTRASAQYFLAIACFRSDDPENGAKWLQQAEAQERQDLKVVDDWHREFTLDLLRREAQQLQSDAAKK